MSDLVKEKLSNLEKKSEKNKASNENDVNSNQRKANEIKVNEVVHKEKQKTRKRTKSKNIIKREANRIIKLFKPISVTMLAVILSIYYISFFSEGPDSEIMNRVVPFIEKEESSAGEKLISVLITVIIFAVILILVTTCITMIYIWQYFLLINIFFIFAFLIYLGLFFGIYFQELLHEINYIVVDKITAFLIISNYAMTGIVMLFIGGPKIMAQSYHVMMSALLALIFIKLIPSWTTWGLLFAVSIWDIYAVLHQNGPLNKLFKAQEEKGKALPPIIYSAAISLSKSSTEDESDIDLGLGDFIFYSLLVGRTFSSTDLLTAIICFISILVGLAITLFLLIMTDKALPALPISIFFGIISNVIGVYCVQPFNNELTSRQLYL